MSNIYQPIIDEINKLGGKATSSQGSYMLLFRLAKIKGQDMNGSAAVVGKAHGFPRNKVVKMAKESLNLYLSSGQLVIPSYFKYRERNQYKHDGDATANRNLWRTNKKIYTNLHNDGVKPEYTLNTTKK